MEFEIIKEKENPLFGRKEVQVSLDAEITPSNKDVTDSLAQKFSSQSENISVRGIHGKFGSKEFIIDANIYSSKEEKENMETKKKKSEEKNAESQSDPENKELIKINSSSSDETNVKPSDNEAQENQT